MTGTASADHRNNGQSSQEQLVPCPILQCIVQLVVCCQGLEMLKHTSTLIHSTPIHSQCTSTHMHSFTHTHTHTHSHKHAHKHAPYTHTCTHTNLPLIHIRALTQTCPLYTYVHSHKPAPYTHTCTHTNLLSCTLESIWKEGKTITCSV